MRKKIKSTVIHVNLPEKTHRLLKTQAVFLAIPLVSHAERVLTAYCNSFGNDLILGLEDEKDKTRGRQPKLV